LNLNGHDSEAADLISTSVQNVLNTLKNTPDYAAKNQMQEISEENLKRLAQSSCAFGIIPLQISEL
jgi:isocitrate/isopropylmalate dehydrogenase